MMGSWLSQVSVLPADTGLQDPAASLNVLSLWFCQTSSFEFKLLLYSIEKAEVREFHHPKPTNLSFIFNSIGTYHYRKF